MSEQKDLERVVSGALRSAIHDHGPITLDKIGSATKRIVGNLRNKRRGGVARKKTGVDYKELGAAGGRAGKGTKKPRSEEAKRTMLARRLLRAAAKNPDGLVSATLMERLTGPERPRLHYPMPLQDAATALGVGREVLALRIDDTKKGTTGSAPA